ncbi:MAG TPA: hypothetical protein PKA21_08950 [Kiritimatiellia bacterium]|nr:hypothetical protein [Kiritimatiellia bacterium]HMP35019.1 hypothetical protein [Kiritimatiellia bacterium]
MNKVLFILLFTGLTATADVFVVDGNSSRQFTEGGAGTVRFASDNGYQHRIDVLSLYQGATGSVKLIKPDGSARLFEPTNDTARARGDAFTSAYHAAASGDLLLLSEGQFNTHDPAFSPAGKSVFRITKPDLTIQGQGRKTVIDAKWVFLATNNTLQSFTLTNSFNDDVLIFQSNATNANHQSVFRDLSIYASTGSTHVVQFSGSGLVIENVHTYVPPSGVAHPFVLKGVSNVVVRNCSSTGNPNNAGVNGLLIKAAEDGGQRLVSDVLVDGFTINGAATGIRIAPDDSNTAIRNVRLRNVMAEGVPGAGLFVGATSGGYTNNVVTNLVVDGLTVRGPASDSLHIYACSGSFALRNADFETTASPSVLNAGYEYPVYSLFQVRLANRSLADGIHLRRTYPDGPVSSARYNVIHTGLLSLGLNSTSVRTLFGNTNTQELTIAWPFAFAVGTNYWKAGDPVWVATGTYAGVHRLKSWNQTFVTNQPVTHAGTGDYFVVTEYFGTNSGTAASSIVRFGKAFADVPYSATALTYARPLVELKAWYTENFYNLRHFRTYAVTVAYGAAGAPATLYHNQLDSYTAAGGELNLIPRVYAYDNTHTNLQFALFGDYTGVTALYGNSPRFYDVTVEMTVNGSSQFMDQLRVKE